MRISGGVHGGNSRGAPIVETLYHAQRSSSGSSDVLKMTLADASVCQDGQECSNTSKPAAARSTPDASVDMQTSSSSSPTAHTEQPDHQEGSERGEVVRLISAEGRPVEVPVRVARECEFLERMLSGSFTESRTRELSLPNIRYRALSKVVEYLRRRAQWREGGGVPLEFEMDDDIAVDLLIAADYLGLK
ncbi:uncharacterized protein LOC34623276 [Cyclospora cayetanensis]|uniref:Elongin-C n=2 Tax=Cyclospora cayetanensis TaxID=88456 RepID=A0A1D3CZY3_9EIME|nr:uncharacterized protein LOC34623276 [Cyclospora cayetanensis]OEH76764.1 putative elongin c [Cyclospora cayetanensis]